MPDTIVYIVRMNAAAESKTVAAFLSLEDAQVFTASLEFLHADMKRMVEEVEDAQTLLDIGWRQACREWAKSYGRGEMPRRKYVDTRTPHYPAPYATPEFPVPFHKDSTFTVDTVRIMG